MPKSASFKVTLYNGSELYANRHRNGDWSIDIFPVEYPDGTPVLRGDTVEPTYHAYYWGVDAEIDARADADSWAKWYTEYRRYPPIGGGA